MNKRLILIIVLLIPTTIMISMEQNVDLAQLNARLVRQAQIIVLDKQEALWITKKIAELIHQPDINAADDLGNTRLHYAAFVRNGNLILDLLKAGANPLAINAHGQDFTDIIEHLIKTLSERRERNDMATEYQRIVRYLAKNDVNIRFHNGDTLLHKAIKIQDTPLALALMKQLHPNALNNNARTPLHEALYSPLYNTTLVTSLLKNNANPLLKDHDGNTALHIAMLTDNTDTDLINLLLQHNADPDALNAGGMTPLEILIQKINENAKKYHRIQQKLDQLKQQEKNNAITVQKYIFDRDKKETLQNRNSLLKAIDQEVAILFLLLLKSKNKNRQDEFGNTALYHLILIMRTSNEVHKLIFPILAHFLPELNLDIQNREGFTPLHAAVSAQDVSLVLLLLERGANPLIKSFTKPLSMDQMRRGLKGDPDKTPRQLALEIRAGLTEDTQTILATIIDTLERAEQKRETNPQTSPPNSENTSHTSNTL